MRLKISASVVMLVLCSAGAAWMALRWSRSNTAPSVEARIRAALASADSVDVAIQGVGPLTVTIRDQQALRNLAPLLHLSECNFVVNLEPYYDVSVRQGRRVLPFELQGPTLECNGKTFVVNAAFAARLHAECKRVDSRWDEESLIREHSLRSP